MQFANREATSRPQKLHIRWELLTRTDDSINSPDERDEGFWPSQDPDSPGYVGEVSAEEFADHMAKAESLMERFQSGEWEYVGVLAAAHLLIPIGGGSFRIMKLESAGLWGIESYCEDYIREVFEEEKAGLLRELETLGAALASGDFIQEGEGVA